MGDIADMIVDDLMLSHWEGETEEPLGRIVCKFCGEGYFQWKQTKTGWRLFDSEGNMHSCGGNFR